MKLINGPYDEPPRENKIDWSVNPWRDDENNIRGEPFRDWWDRQDWAWLQLVGLILYATSVIGVAYVLCHFISKYW